MKKCFIAFILTFCISFTLFIGVGATSINSADIPIKLISDNKIIDTESILANERILIPVRKLLESVGATVQWDNLTQRVDLTRNGKKISLHIGSNILVTPNGNKDMDTAPILYNGNTTYAPIRAIAEEFGLSVDWDNGTKTILITSPEGCRYVDLYDGMTVKQAIEMSGMSAEEFNAETGLDYQKYKDKLYVQSENEVATSLVAKSYGMTFAELKEFMGFDDSITESTHWGVAVGSISLRNYINAFLEPAQYGMNAEQVLELIRELCGLGNEYTLDTKYRYVRTIMETTDYETPKAEANPKGDIIIPDITKGKIEMDFLNKLIDKVGNGKLKLDYYTLPPGVVTAMSRVKDGIYYAYSINIDRVAYLYNAVSVVTVDGAPADEIEAFYQAFREALIDNGYRFVKTDEDGVTHYVKGTQEFEIKNIDNKSFPVHAATSYMSCCAKGSN